MERYTLAEKKNLHQSILLRLIQITKFKLWLNDVPTIFTIEGMLTVPLNLNFSV